MMPALGVYSLTRNGQRVGSIWLWEGHLEMDPPSLLDFVTSETVKAATAEEAYSILDGWSNGYIWVKPLPPSEQPQEAE